MTPPLVATEPESDDAPGRRGTARIHLRNYDHRQGHSIRVVTDRRGRESSVRRYLAPGQSATVDGIDAAGAVAIRVTVDGIERKRTACQLDDPPGTTAVVEVGNGVVSVRTDRPHRTDGD